MFFKRWIVLALAVLLVIGVFSAISGAGQREAWMQGYMAGRLSTGTDGGAAIAPYMMYGGNFGPHFGFGGIGFFWGVGLLLLGFFLIGRRLHWRGHEGGPEDWHERMRAEAERWHERHQRRWEGRAPERGGDSEQRMV
jgi:hypothetical protein